MKQPRLSWRRGAETLKFSMHIRASSFQTGLGVVRFPNDSYLKRSADLNFLRQHRNPQAVTLNCSHFSLNRALQRRYEDQN